MNDASAASALGHSAYIVLGLIGLFGPGTSYDLKRWADESVGYFWTFPRSQLYAEPQRLAALGLLREEQEAGGRRRRVYSLTESGRAALRDWLQRPAGFPELRDLGLLKLFFRAQGRPADVTRLAAEQLSLHQARLAEYERLCSSGEASARQPLGMGLLYERASIAFWQEVLAGSAEDGAAAVHSAP